MVLKKEEIVNQKSLTKRESKIIQLRQELNFLRCQLKMTKKENCPVRTHKHHKEETHLTKGGRNCTKGRVRKGLRNAMLSLAIPSTLQGNYRPRSEATTSLAR